MPLRRSRDTPWARWAADHSVGPELWEVVYMGLNSVHNFPQAEPESGFPWLSAEF